MLCADVWDGVRECSVQALKEAVAAEKAEGGFDSNFLEPPVFTAHGGPAVLSRDPTTIFGSS